MRSSSFPTITNNAQLGHAFFRGTSNFMQMSPLNLKITALAAIFLIFAVALAYSFLRARYWKAEQRSSETGTLKVVNEKAIGDIAKAIQKECKNCEINEGSLQAVFVNDPIKSSPPQSPFKTGMKEDEVKNPLDKVIASEVESRRCEMVQTDLACQLPDHLPAVPSSEPVKIEKVVEKRLEADKEIEIQHEDHAKAEGSARVIVSSEPIKRPVQSMPIPPIPPLDIDALFADLAARTQSIPSNRYDSNCRFTDILCPIATRVEVPGATDTLYLHANNVKLEGLNFIATQYPLPEQFSLFWRAAQSACLILDLTNKKDMGQGLSPYYPLINQAQTCDQLIVKCKAKQPLKTQSCALYFYTVEGLENMQHDSPSHARRISRLHFEGWNDHHGITEDEMDHLIAIMDEYQENPVIPILIHCRAGVGRTGTLMVARGLWEEIKLGKLNASNLIEHMSRDILEGRLQRGPGFVQTSLQLSALWKWAWRAVHQGPSQLKPSSPT